MEVPGLKPRPSGQPGWQLELGGEDAPAKASGAGSWTDAEAMFEAGAERIGASSGDVIAQEYLEQQGT